MDRCSAIVMSDQGISRIAAAALAGHACYRSVVVGILSRDAHFKVC